MKKIFTVLFTLISLSCFAQDNSDLYLQIDSLIRYQIQYEYDSTTDQLPKYEWDSAKTRMPSVSTFPPNPSPLIILNGQKISREDLNEYKLSQIAKIDLYQKEDIKLQALYGTSAKNGAVIIQTKKFQKKRRKKN